MDEPLGIDRAEIQKHLDAATDFIQREIEAGMRRYAEIVGQGTEKGV